MNLILYPKFILGYTDYRHSYLRYYVFPFACCPLRSYSKSFQFHPMLQRSLTSGCRSEPFDQLQQE